MSRIYEKAQQEHEIENLKKLINYNGPPVKTTHEKNDVNQ